MIFLTADTHIDHLNIIKYCNRPFTATDEMNTTIIANTNNAVGVNDTLWHLGDVAWNKIEWYFEMVKCKNIHLIPGNHDVKVIHRLDKLHTLGRIKLYRAPDPYNNITVNTTICGQKVSLSHFPHRSWNCSFHGAYSLYGHVHGNIKNPDPNSMDVGVDPNGFTPVSWDRVLQVMKEFGIRGATPQT